jgi:hypothetical protein
LIEELLEQGEKSGGEGDTGTRRRKKIVESEGFDNLRALRADKVGQLSLAMVVVEPGELGLKRKGPGPLLQSIILTAFPLRFRW